MRLYLRRELEDELKENPEVVEAKDAKGRTALDLEYMRLLIEYGSGLDSMDITGRTTVLHADIIQPTKE